MTAMGCTNYFQFMGSCLAHSTLLGNIRGFRTSSTTRVFHFKVITSQDVRICINIHTKLNIAVADIDCEGFSITHIFIFSLLPYFTLFVIPFILWFHIVYT